MRQFNYLDPQQLSKLIDLLVLFRLGRTRLRAVTLWLQAQGFPCRNKRDARELLVLSIARSKQVSIAMSPTRLPGPYPLGLAKSHR